MDTIKNSTSSYALACGMVLLQSLIYGLGDPITKYAYDRFPVYYVLAIRYSVAALVIGLLAGKALRQSLTKEKLKVLLLPSLCIALAYFINNIALSLAPATTVAFLRSLSVVMVPILSYFMYRTPYSKKHLPIHIAVVIGLYLLCGVADSGLNGFGWGEIMTLVGASMLAGTLVFGKNALKSVDSLTLTSVQTMASVIVCVPMAFVTPEPFVLENMDLSVWAVTLYLALLCTLGGYLLQNRALALISDRVVALLQCACPIMTAGFSYYILGERLSFNAMVGAAIILICIVAETQLRED